MDYKGAQVKGLKVIPSSSNPNWLNIPPDVMVLIMQRVDWFDVLMNVKQVCKYWHEISKDPSIWRFMVLRKDILTGKLRMKMDMIGEIEDNYKTRVDKAWEKMVMHAIDLSSGQLHDLCLHGFGSDNLLHYIYQRSSQLRRLRLQYCHVKRDYRHDLCISQGAFIGMLRNLPLLEELQFAYCSIPIKCIEVAGRCCSHLKSLSINQRGYKVVVRGYGDYPDVEALAIAKYMPTLRHLQLFGNRMTSEGLKAILENCNHLEYLDLRLCFNLEKVLKKDIDFEIELRQLIKHVRLPWDSTEDYEFDAAIY